MLLGSRAIVKSRLNVARFIFELLEYEWDVGTEVFEIDANTVLRWRMEPRLDWPGRIGESNAGNFGQLMLPPPDTPPQSMAPAPRAGHRQVVACQYDPAWLSETTGLSSGAQNVTKARGKLNRPQLDRIRELILDNDGRCPTVAVLGAALGISDTHLRRMFKATTGQTIHSYVEQVRLGRAKLLLTTTDLPLKVVSYRLGFAHPSAFTAAFSRSTGQSPKVFRRSYLVNRGDSDRASPPACAAAARPARRPENTPSPIDNPLR